ncbi:MAG: hypothetical protein WD055_02375 [Candidatus Dependentiae bacterium]
MDSLIKFFIWTNICFIGQHALYSESNVYKAFLANPYQQPQYHRNGYNNKHKNIKKYNSLVNNYTAESYNHLSQTEVHLAKHFHDKLHWQLQDPLVSDMCHRLIEQELREQQKGKYTLLHAQPWELNLLEDIYTTLWQELHNKTFSKYIFARFRSLSLTENDLKKHIHMRSQLSSQGQNTGYSTAGKFALCANFGLFCNEGSTNSFSYFKNNSSMGIPHYLNLKHIFSKLNLKKYYTMFQKELDYLKQEHKNLTSYGHILMFSLTPDLLKKIVYPSTGGFYNASYNYINNTPNVANIQDLLDTFRKKPWDIYTEGYHFCIILSKDCGLIPGNGLDIYEFNAIDKAKLQAFENKKKALMDKILLKINFDLSQEPSKAQKKQQAIIAKAHLWKKHGCLISQNNLWNQYLQQQVGQFLN